MTYLNCFFSLILGIVALTSNHYFAKEYGFESNTLILPVICMALAIIFAFNSGEMWGRRRQQEDMVEAMNKQQELIVEQMKEARGKLQEMQIIK